MIYLCGRTFNSQAQQSEIQREFGNPFSQRFLSTKVAKMNSRKYFSSSNKVYYNVRESMDSCKLPLGEFKRILTLGCDFLTLPSDSVFADLGLFNFYFLNLD